MKDPRREVFFRWAVPTTETGVHGWSVRVLGQVFMDGLSLVISRSPDETK
jgi:hypothetical protein